MDTAVVESPASNCDQPFPRHIPNFHHQALYNHTLLNQSGIIDKIYYQKVTSSPDYIVIENLSVRLAHSSNDSLGTVFEAHRTGPWMEVLNVSSLNLSGAPPVWAAIDVDNTFTYDGVSNLLVDLRYQGLKGPAGGTRFAADTSTALDLTLWSSDLSSPTGSLYTWQSSLGVLFANSANLSWSATSATPWLFSAATVGNELRISPEPNAFGVGNATLTLTNSNGESTFQRILVQINPINDAPELSGMPVGIMCTEDIDYVLNMSAYASDIDNTIDELTYSEDSLYATVDGMDIIFNYPEGVTTDSVNITVEDPGALTDFYVLNVTVSMVNDPPELHGYVDNITCDATVPYEYDTTAGDEETPLDIYISTISAYANVSGDTITFLYPKGVGSETVTISVVDGLIYGTQNTVTYKLNVTVIDHPDVISNSPTGTGVSLTTSVEVTFDMVMNSNTTEAAFRLSSASDPNVNGTFSWNTAGTTMTFTPTDYLETITYDVIIGPGATNANGIPMLTQFDWNFSVDGNVDADGDGMPDQWEVDGGLDPEVNDAASDADGDGMPNLYEYQNNLSPSTNDAEGDADGDGVTNFEEYEAGTDPNDPEDKPTGIPWLIIIIILAIVIIAIIAAVALSKRKREQPDFPDEQHPPSPPQQAPPPEQPPMEQPPPPEQPPMEQPPPSE
jgi:hypothetical protein